MTPVYNASDTIYALSSGAGRGGVAVIRVSGRQVRTVLERIARLSDPQPRYAYFRPLVNNRAEVLDQALVLYFNAPHSFTGEDVAEFQVHGGRAVIAAVMRAIGEI
ncbi:MAG: tRNA uridine-5-carboxymethylaminomethyl(34) synthesis GTPase MnmE, partial [Alphaproteobacteria bacterium]